MKAKIKKGIVVGVAVVALAFSMTGCASMQQGLNSLDTDMNGRMRTVTVYGVDGEEIATFECRCTIRYENGSILFDNLDTNERTAIFGQCATVVAVDKTNN